MKQKFSQRLIIVSFLFSLFLPSFIYANSGNISGSHKYAWSDQVGYINFSPANGGVTVSDTTLSGYAWSENTGYINFSPANGGVLNDGHGNLSGFAWGEGIGYIDFSNVSINSLTGQFSGTATGDMIGTLTFNCPTFCDVQTEWRPIASGLNGGGGRLRPIIPVSEPPQPETSAQAEVSASLSPKNTTTSPYVQPASTGSLLREQSSTPGVKISKISNIFSVFLKIFNDFKILLLTLWQKFLSLIIFIMEKFKIL